MTSRIGQSWTRKTNDFTPKAISSSGFEVRRGNSPSLVYNYRRMHNRNAAQKKHWSTTPETKISLLHWSDWSSVRNSYSTDWLIDIRKNSSRFISIVVFPGLRFRRWCLGYMYRYKLFNRVLLFISMFLFLAVSFQYSISFPLKSARTAFYHRFLGLPIFFCILGLSRLFSSLFSSVTFLYDSATVT